MTDKKVIQDYINNLRRRIAQFLKPGIGLACSVYRAETGGAILEFTIGRGIERDDIYKEVSPSLSQALSKIRQRAFGGNLEGFVFTSTNLILEDNRIILIKDDSPSEWTDNAAQRDITRLLSEPRKTTR